MARAATPAKAASKDAANNSGAPKATGALVLADGSVFLGHGCGHVGSAVGEVCFNTAITGYQEILTDPSYADQIVTFTFPHIGNVGANNDDREESSTAGERAARGAVFKAPITAPSNWRSTEHFDAWLKRRAIVGLSGLDTRALTRRIRENGMPNGIIAHAPDGKFDLDALKSQAKAWSGLEGLDLAKDVTRNLAETFNEKRWVWPQGYTQNTAPRFKVAVLDYGAKSTIMRCLADIGAEAIVFPASAKASDILAQSPDGILISNGPGDPAATAKYAGKEIATLAHSGIPVMGICLGHQMLALALGAKTLKMPQGHHGANHPVQDLATGKVEIVSMNHGFAVDRESLPNGVKETHVSLFDGSNCGIALEGKPVFSVQYHPEASPGPRDSFYLFERFAAAMDQKKVS